METLFEGVAAEVDEQSDGQMHQPEIRQELLAVDGSQLFYGF